MNSETGIKSNLNLGSSFITSNPSIDYQNSEYGGYFFWTSYFHQLNQQSNRQSMVNFSTQLGPQNYLNVTEKGLNLTHPLIQRVNYSPISSASSSQSSSSNVKDLCSFNPSNPSKNAKNPQADNNSLKCRPICDNLNSKDDINKYIVNGVVPSNQYSISENLNGDCPQKLVVDGHGGNEYKKKMTSVGREIPSSFEITKPTQRRTYQQTCPVNQPQSKYTYPTKEYAVVDELQMDEIIAKELDLALSLSKKGRKNHRLSHQAKQKTRSKTGKKTSIKNKLISLTVERIKAAVFNCSPNPSSFQTNKISNHEAKQQSKQNQSFSLEAWNQYQTKMLSGQFQHPQLVFQPKSEVMRQPADPQSVGRKSKRCCTCKNPGARTNNAIPSSSTSVSNHSNVPASNFNLMNGSLLELLHR